MKGKIKYAWVDMREEMEMTTHNLTTTTLSDSFAVNCWRLATSIVTNVESTAI